MTPVSPSPVRVYVVTWTHYLYAGHRRDSRRRSRSRDRHSSRKDRDRSRSESPPPRRKRERKTGFDVLPPGGVIPGVGTIPGMAAAAVAVPAASGFSAAPAGTLPTKFAMQDNWHICEPVTSHTSASAVGIHASAVPPFLSHLTTCLYTSHCAWHV